MNISETMIEQHRRDVDARRLTHVLAAPKRERVSVGTRRLARPLRGTGIRLLRIAERLEA